MPSPCTADPSVVRHTKHCHALADIIIIGMVVRRKSHAACGVLNDSTTFKIDECTDK